MSLHQHHLGYQYLFGAVEHLALTVGKALLPVPPHKALDDTGHFQQITALQPVQVLPIASVPVGGAVDLQPRNGTQHLPDATGGGQGPDADGPAAACGDLQRQPAGGHSEHVVAAQLSAQPFLHDTFDDPRPVHGVNHPVAYLIHTGPSFPNDSRV